MESKIDPSLLEVLKIAKELTINHHADKRAELHNKWLLESDTMWKARRLRVAYPPIPPYPSEEDILIKAKSMLEFLHAKPTQAEVKEVLVKIDTPEEVVPVAEPVIETVVPITEIVVEPEKEEPIEQVVAPVEPIEKPVGILIKANSSSDNPGVFVTGIPQEILDLDTPEPEKQTSFFKRLWK